MKDDRKEDICTSNIDFAAYLDVKGFKLIKTTVDHKGICSWVFESKENVQEPFMDFLQKDEVPALSFAEAIRRNKKIALETKRSKVAEVPVFKRR